MQELQIAQRLSNPDAFSLVAAAKERGVSELLDHLAGARMDGKDDRKPDRDLMQSFQDSEQHAGIVDVRCPVQSQGCEAPLLQSEPLHQIEVLGRCTMLCERIYHYIANEVNPFL